MEYAKFPTNTADLKLYIGDQEAVLRDARTGQFFRLNPAVAGRAPESVKKPEETLMLYTPPGAEAEPICAAFCDGSVRLLTREQFDAALKTVQSPSGDK